MKNSKGKDLVSNPSLFTNWVSIVLLIYALLVAVALISDGFKMATVHQALTLFEFAANPIVALIIGIVATASIQSSSTVTSIIVGLVAGGLPMNIAIPMAMGSNIGTSLTSTIVSIGHINQGEEFKRAFAAATVHDSFNLCAVAILLPIELLFHPLEFISTFFSTIINPGSGVEGLKVENPIDFLLSPIVFGFKLLSFYLPLVWDGVFLIFIGLVLIISVVMSMGALLKRLMVGRSLSLLQNSMGKGSISSMGTGGLITVLVQSSSTTTALIVPMAGSGLVSLRQVYPFTLGGNLGTTITALLAALAIKGPSAILAMQIALVHFFFNFFAIAIIYTIPFFRNVPIIMAEKLAEITQKNKWYALSYIIIVFFAAPLFILLLSRVF